MSDTRRHGGIGRGVPAGLAIAILGLTLWSPHASAQELDPGLVAWVGCWVPVGAVAEGMALCYRPAPVGGGLELVAVSEGRIESREILEGRGEERETLREGCEGTESASLSDDGRRLYTRSSHTCEGGVERSATGIMAFVSPTQWVDVRAVSTASEPVASVQFYQLASSDVVAEAGQPELSEGLTRAAADARRVASLPPSLDQVAEASRNADAEAVEAWVVEVARPFRLTGDELVELDEAGVPAGVIDAVVAVSFPQKFRIDRAGDAHEDVPVPAAYPAAYRGLGAPIPLYFGYGYDYYYRYGLPGSGYWYRGYRPVHLIVTPRAERTSRVINGRGYTQGRGSSTGTVRRSGGSDGGSYRPSSGGSTSGGTPRKAKRRGGA